MISNSLPNDAALRTRARHVIPGGMYGHLNVARLPEGYPQFFARAEGAARTRKCRRRPSPKPCARCATGRARR